MNHIHYFDTRIAKQYGVDCAIIFNLINILIESNRDQEFDQYCIDGIWFCKASYQILAKSGGYYSSDQIKRIMKKLRDAGLIDNKALSENRYDRTNYYCISPLGERYLLHSSKSPDGEFEENPSIVRNQTIDQAKSPDVNKDNISSNISSSISFNKQENENQKISEDQVSILMTAWRESYASINDGIQPKIYPRDYEKAYMICQYFLDLDPENYQPMISQFFLGVSKHPFWSQQMDMKTLSENLNRIIPQLKKQNSNDYTLDGFKERSKLYQQHRASKNRK